jgi:hypothetical protein
MPGLRGPRPFPFQAIAIDSYNQDVPFLFSLLQAPNMANMEDVETPIGKNDPLPPPFKAIEDNPQLVLCFYLFLHVSGPIYPFHISGSYM